MAAEWAAAWAAWAIWTSEAKRHPGSRLHAIRDLAQNERSKGGAPAPPFLFAQR